MKNVQGTTERKMMQEEGAKSSFKNPQIPTTWSLRKDLKTKDEPQNTQVEMVVSSSIGPCKGFFTTVTVQIRKRPDRLFRQP